MHTAHSRTHTCNGRSGSNAGRRNREHSTAFYPLAQPFFHAHQFTCTIMIQCTSTDEL